MRNTLMLYVDQYGNKIWAKTVKDLKAQAGPGKVFKIYCDMKPDGKSYHVGYGVGRRWFNAFQPLKVAA